MAFVADLLPESNGTSFIGASLRILLGVTLIAWAAVKVVRWLWARGHDPGLPGWMASIERTTPLRAARLAVILSAVNVKEVAFGVGGASRSVPATSVLARPSSPPSATRSWRAAP